MIKPQPPLRPTASPGLSPSLVWDCFPSHSPRAALLADTGPLHLVSGTRAARGPESTGLAVRTPLGCVHIASARLACAWSCIQGCPCL